VRVACTVNGSPRELDLEPRELLVDVIRDRLNLTGVHVACEHGACGTCTVLVDGQGVRSCLMFGVQVAGHDVTTVEGVTSPPDLHPIQQALTEHHGLQCGFCTPAIVLTALELLRDTADPTTEEIAEGMSGVLCRCTGYVPIIDAIRALAATDGEG
jgi:aerobic carbon-monoxide dehydrogenase small subunit